MAETKDVAFMYCDIINPIALELNEAGVFEKLKKSIEGILSQISELFDIKYSIDKGSDNVLGNRYLIYFAEPRNVLRVAMMLFLGIKGTGIVKFNCLGMSVGINNMELISDYDITTSIGKAFNYTKLAASGPKYAENHSSIFKIHTDYFNLNRLDFVRIDNFIDSLDSKSCSELFMKMLEDKKAKTGNSEVDSAIHIFDNFSFAN